MEYEYDALHEDELTLRQGDIIKNVCYIEEEGWMEGELNGKRGVFPDNFVKVIEYKFYQICKIWFLTTKMTEFRPESLFFCIQLKSGLRLVPNIKNHPLFGN